MFVKLFTQILDSSIADNRRLRHFFTDLLLCSDAKGFVMMTPTAIARRIGTTVEEVEWGLSELEKPDPHSKTPDYEGRRIMRLDGVGYGWLIINYESYRALKDGDQMREATKQRVKRFREKAKAENVTPCNASVTPCNADVTHVTLGNAITEAEAEAEAEANTDLVNTQSVKLSKTDMATKIYKLYPKKVGKDAAFKAIVSALGKIRADELIEAVTAFAQISKGTDMQYIPNPATWFNQGRWADDRETWKPRTQGNAGARQPSTHATRSGHAETEQYEIPDL